MDDESIFAAALALTSQDERQAYLDRACGNNVALRGQVEDLLRADADAGSFIARPALENDRTRHEQDADTTPEDAIAAADVCARLEPCSTPGRIGKLGTYEIIEVIGSGGMGTVLRGFDVKLRRVVAVKVLSPQLAASAIAVKRFLREAQSAAAVHHDHVVTVHAVEDQHRPPFLVMEFVQGRTLQQKIDLEGELPLQQILRIGAQMAAGLTAAHKQGLIHRDVKPANILLENGVQRVKITDFGLARAADDVAMTVTGVVAGTPQYMSPEQAKGEPVDCRSDLFSLGSVLYTMCAGRPAFRAETTLAVLRRVCDDSPAPLATVNPQIPAWLSVIVMRLLEKDPAARYQTAAEVAALLEQCGAHVQNAEQHPLPACAAELPDRLVEPARRQWTRWLALLAVLLFASLLVLLSIDGDSRSALLAAIQGTRAERPALAIAPRPAPESSKRSALAPRLVLKGHGSWVHSLAFSPNGKTLATGSNDQRVRLFDTKTGGLQGEFHADEGLISSLAYSTDGALLVAASNRGKVGVWDAATLDQLAEVTHGANAFVAFSRSDSMLATSSWDKTVRLWRWDGSVLQPIRTFKDQSSAVAAMSFNPQGTTIAVLTEDEKLSLWDVESGELLESVELGQMLVCLAFSPDGSTIAVGGYGKNIEVRAADTLKPLGTLRGHQEGVTSLVFLPDGKTLVSAGAHFDSQTCKSTRPGELKLWDVAALKERLSVGGFENGVACVALSPDGKTLATGDHAKLARLWDVAALLAAAGIHESPSPVLQLHFDEDDFYPKDGRTYVRDRSGRGNDGLCEDVRFTREGQTGGGLSNDGKGFLRLNSSLVAGEPNFTVVGWVKPADDAARGWVYGVNGTRYPDIDSPRFTFSSQPGPNLFATAWNNDIWIGDTYSYDQTISPNAWIFIAMALENGGPGKGRVRLMLNDRLWEKMGQEIGRDDYPIQDFVGAKLDGVVDEVAVWHRALTEAELRELFKRGQEKSARKPATTSAETSVIGQPYERAMSAAKRIGTGGRASWSPDGKRLLYAKDPGLRLLDLATGEMKTISETGRDAAYSPTDERFAYVDGSGAENTVWLMDIDGKNKHMVALGSFPTWNADGKSLYFHSPADGMVRTVNLSDAQPLIRDYVAVKPWYPAVSPDGKWVAYVELDHLVVRDVKSGERREHPFGKGNGGLVNWSPDSRRVGFSGYGQGDRRGLWVFEIATGSVTQMATGPRSLPAWSPDGKRLAFDLREPSKERGIWIAELESIAPRPAAADK